MTLSDIYDDWKSWSLQKRPWNSIKLLQIKHILNQTMRWSLKMCDLFFMHYFNWEQMWKKFYQIHLLLKRTWNPHIFVLHPCLDHQRISNDEEPFHPSVPHAQAVHIHQIPTWTLSSLNQQLPANVIKGNNYKSHIKNEYMYVPVMECRCFKLLCKFFQQVKLIKFKY